MDKGKKTEMNMQNTGCQPMDFCIPQETMIRNVRLAAAYVPFQALCRILPPLEALKMGTAYPELYSPYEGKNKKHEPCCMDERR
jgi:hypothetical protein